MSVYLCWSRIGDGVCDLPESYRISSQLRKSSSNGEEHLITSRCESCTQLIRLLPRFVQSIGLIYLFLGTKSSLGMQNWRRWLPTQGSSPRRTTVTGRITRSNVFCMYSRTLIGWSWNSHHIFRISTLQYIKSYEQCLRSCQIDAAIWRITSYSSIRILPFSLENCIPALSELAIETIRSPIINAIFLSLILLGPYYGLTEISFNFFFQFNLSNSSWYCQVSKDQLHLHPTSSHLLIYMLIFEHINALDATSGGIHRCMTTVVWNLRGFGIRVV